MPPKEATYRCALCGPSSLHGDRKEKDCECHASRSGFKKRDHDVYVSCSRCGSKMSIECLDALSAKVDELDYPLHDPEGVWEALLARPWASDRHDDPPLQGWCDNERSLGPCILCEQGVLPTAEPDPVLDEIKKLGADHDPAVAVAVPVMPVFPDGRRTGEMARHLHVVHLFPLVNPHDSESLFKNGTGSLAETGCVPRPAPLATAPRPTAPQMTSAVLATSPFPLSPYLQYPSHRSLDVGQAIPTACRHEPTHWDERVAVVRKHHSHRRTSSAAPRYAPLGEMRACVCVHVQCLQVAIVVEYQPPTPNHLSHPRSASIGRRRRHPLAPRANPDPPTPRPCRAMPRPTRAPCTHHLPLRLAAPRPPSASRLQSQKESSWRSRVARPTSRETSVTSSGSLLASLATTVALSTS